MSTTPKLKFKYVIIKHPTDYAIHEAFADWNSSIIAVNGEPLTASGYSKQALVDTVGAIAKDIADAMPIEGDCEDLFEAWDLIEANAYDYSPQEPRKALVLDLVKK